jgi:prepilin signal peptidase PulO-like enzyme (type II secretory pathway)
MALWQDTLLEWGIPVILIGALVSVALLGAFDEIAPTTGVLTLSGLLLLFVAFLLFKPVLMSATEVQYKPWIWGLALAWLVITCTQVYFSIFVGQEITSGSITTESGGIDLPLGAQGTVYDLVLAGNFSTAGGEGKREGSYSLLLEKDGQKIQELTGMFSETLARQRLGRRGSTTTRHLHNHVLHPLISPGEGTYHLTLTRVDAQLTPTLEVALYRDTYPEKIFWVLSILLLVGAYIGERWYVALEPPFVLVTTAALTFVLTFRHLGVPPHNYQDIIGAFMVAAIVGPLVGWIFRVIADVIAKNIGYAKPKPAGASSGKGKGGKGKN